VEKYSLMTVRRRIATFFLIIAVLALFLTLRLAYLQIWQGDRLAEMALAQRNSPVPILPERGTIYDRNMKPLATSISAEAVYATPIEVKNKQATAYALAPLLDLQPEWLEEQFNKNVRFVWLRLKVTPDIIKQVRSLNLPGIYIAERPQRFYPYGNLASQILGFAGIDNQGLEGIEFYYDEILRGIPGTLIRERDANGVVIPDGIERRIPPTDGLSIKLTIDEVLQHIAERELERGVLEAQAERGVFIAVNPNTGELLAVANYPSFDPNNFADYPSEYWKNRAFVDQYEPGSTFKVITGTTALEVGAASLDDTFVDPVRLQRWGGVVHCWRDGGHGTQTLVEATENSCNPVFAILAADMIGPVQFYKYIKAFGFGEPLGVDFPGEGTGILPKPTSYPTLEWANVGFGQGIAVTPLQMAMAVSAIANGGLLYRPYLVSEVISGDQEVMQKTQPEVIRRVVSQQSAKDFAAVMRSVVVNGSGSRADIAGYQVAGKTGTAQIAEGGRYIDLNMAGFVAFAPLENPQIVGVVFLYKVHQKPSYGGTWAAPIMGRFLEEALEYLGVPRKIETQSKKAEQVRVPNVRNLPVDEAFSILKAEGFKVAEEGTGGYVLEMTPQPGVLVDKGTTVLVSLYTEPIITEDVKVPDLSGRSMRDAALLLHEKGLKIRIEGTGVVEKQNPAAGTVVPSGTIVEVRFKPVSSKK
jgi:stage V sporulation protein D (sporulation-specific penicillin-binding protein)